MSATSKWLTIVMACALGFVVLDGQANAQTVAADLDYDSSGKVDFADFLVFVGNFGARTGSAQYDAAKDFNADGQIDFEDFLTFVSFFGQLTVEPDPIPVDDLLRMYASGSYTDITASEASAQIRERGTLADVALFTALSNFISNRNVGNLLGVNDTRAAALVISVLAGRGLGSGYPSTELELEGFAPSGSSSFYTLAQRAAGVGQAFFDEMAQTHTRYRDLHQNDLYKDLIVLTGLYNHFGDATAAQSLLDGSNISFFGRYEQSTLIHMVENQTRLTDAPLAVIAFSKRDSSGAYYQYATHIDDLLGRGYDVRAFEADKEQLWADHIKAIGQQFGKIDLLVIMGHGLPGLISLKPAVAQSDGIIRDFGAFPQWLDVDDWDTVEAIKDYFVETPDVIINACETGYQDVSLPTSLARFFSEVLHARVFSPIDITYLSSIATDVIDGQLVITDVTFGGQTAVYEPTQTGIDPEVPIADQLSLELIEIEGGSFDMGSPFSEQGRSTLEFQRRVTLSTYAISKTEITQGDWFVVMETKPWLGQPLTSSDPTRPAVYISWEAAQEFIDVLNEAEGAANYRLPTEAEWEFACRAGTTTAWSSGNFDSDLSNVAWYAGSEAKQVATKDPNAWDLYDMHGNVREWVSDYHGNYTGSNLTDPTGATFGTERVVRGGGFYDNATDLRSAARGHESPTREAEDIGFRIVKILE